MPSLRGGGAERVCLTLAEAFASHGVATDLVVFDDDGRLRSELAPEVRFLPLGKRGALASLLPLARYLRNERPQAVLSTLTHANVVAVWARALAERASAGRRTRLVLRDGSSIQACGPAATWRAGLLPTLVRWSYPRADALLANARHIAFEIDSLTGSCPARCLVLPNPLATVRWAGRELADPELPPEEGPLVVAVGRLVPQKDHATLLEAFALLRRRTAATLVILGEGPCRDRLLSRVAALGLERAVALPGFHPPAPYLARARLFVSASLYEGSSNALAEALAAGVPVVATSGSGETAGLLGEGLAAGALVTPGDPKALAAAMACALERRPAAEVLRARVAHHDVDTLLPAYAGLLGIELPPAGRSASD